MRVRAFTLIELMVVVAVIGIAGGLASFAMSDQILAAKSRSDRIGMSLKLRAERDKARERLVGLTVDTDDGGRTVVFHRAIINGTLPSTRTCSHGPVVATAKFDHAALHVPPFSVQCLDENGRPIGTFAMDIAGDDGAVDNVFVDGGGTMTGNKALGEVALPPDILPVQ